MDTVTYLAMCAYKLKTGGTMFWKIWAKMLNISHAKFDLHLSDWSY